MIQVKGLEKRYGDYVALNPINFSIEKGEIVAFLGPNGAGKTTTMRILTGFLPATSGTATIAGLDIFEHPLEIRRKIGYLPENPPLYLELTVTEYLKFIGKIKGLSGPSLQSGIDAVLVKCHLTDVAGRLMANLSKGFRQRVGLAQALIHNPEVIILDEPTVGLDPKQIIEIRELIHNLKDEHTVILSTHILPEATAICQRVIIINKGTIVAIDTPERLASQMGRAEQLAFVIRRTDLFSREEILAIPGVLNVTPSDQEGRFIVEAVLGQDLREDLAQILVAKGWGLLELQRLTASLEDIFLQLTTEEKGEEAA